MTVTVNIVDKSGVAPSELCTVNSTVGPLAKKQKVRIHRVERYYTLEGLTLSAPRSLLFNTRLGAKRHFVSPITVRSPAQLIAIFGSPTHCKEIYHPVS